jgi:hypothetical protein
MSSRAATVGGVLAALVCSKFVMAAPLTDGDLVQSALIAEVRTSQESVIRRRLEESRARLAEQLGRDASRLVGGVIVFASGWKSGEVAQFADSHQFEVLRAEAKVAVGDQGIAHTMSLGASSLYLLDGPLDERLDQLLGQQRDMLLAASQASNGSGSDHYREAAYSQNIRFYKVEVVGPASPFDRVLKGAEAVAVLIDSGDERVRQLASQRETTMRMRGAGRVIEGRHSPSGPLPQVRGRVPVFPGGPPVAPTAPPAQQPAR